MAERQAGLLSQRQLTELGVSRSAVRRHLHVGRWAQPASHVFSKTTGPLSWHQRLWLGPLLAGRTAMIGGLSSAEVLGLQCWHRDEITVLLDDELSFEPVQGIAFFRSRRPLASMRAPTELPLCRLEPAVLLFAGYEPPRRTALGAVTAVVQQRLTTVPRLAAWTEVMKPLRRAREFRALFGDLHSGAGSLAERDLLRACRRHGVALPTAQTSRRDRVGASATPTRNGVSTTEGSSSSRSPAASTTTPGRQPTIGVAHAV